MSSGERKEIIDVKGSTPKTGGNSVIEASSLSLEGNNLDGVSGEQTKQDLEQNLNRGNYGEAGGDTQI